MFGSLRRVGRGCLVCPLVKARPIARRLLTGRVRRDPFVRIGQVVRVRLARRRVEAHGVIKVT